jgi:hypothetical protein
MNKVGQELAVCLTSRLLSPGGRLRYDSISSGISSKQVSVSYGVCYPMPLMFAQDLATIVPNLDPAGLDLLSVSRMWFLLMIITVASNNFTAFNSPISVFWQKMLRYEPSKRITARQALEHEYFKDLAMVQWPASVVCLAFVWAEPLRFIPFMNPCTLSLPRLSLSLSLHFCHSAGYFESGVLCDVFRNIK